MAALDEWVLNANKVELYSEFVLSENKLKQSYDGSIYLYLSEQKFGHFISMS